MNSNEALTTSEDNRPGFGMELSHWHIWPVSQCDRTEAHWGQSLPSWVASVGAVKSNLGKCPSKTCYWTGRFNLSLKKRVNDAGREDFVAIVAVVKRWLKRLLTLEPFRYARPTGKDEKSETFTARSSRSLGQITVSRGPLSRAIARLRFPF